MISVTHLNRQPFVVNSDLIKFIEQSPDTVVTLITGEKFLVLESPGDVIDRIIAYRRKLGEGAGVQHSDSALALLRTSGDED